MRSGRAELAKAWAVIASLALLASVAAARVSITGGTPTGGIAIGLALSLSLIVGTGLDPMNAVVHWPGETSIKRSARRFVRVEKKSGPLGEPKEFERQKRAAPALGLFILLCVALWVLNPDWY